VAPPAPQRLVVFGATGGVGRALVGQALAAGYPVTAFGRDPSRVAAAFAGVAAPPAVVAGSMTDPAAVDRAVAGQDVVHVAVGPRRGDDPAALTAGLGHVVAAMGRHEVRRLLLVSGAGIHVAGDRKPLPDRLISALVRVLNGADVAAKEAQLALLAGSALDWTAVRPPRLVERPATGRGLVADPHTIRGGRQVPYADLAAWMLDEGAARRWVRRAVFVAAGPAGRA
jgi:putative NADH-flavin reductase